jgi:hypothetical protein
MAEANALIVLPDSHGSTKAGDFVSVWLFDGLT